MAAISKACASSVTYPFSVAKARAQVHSNSVSSSDVSVPSLSSEGKDGKSSSARASKKAANHTIFSTVLSVIQSDGPAALYSGLYLELIKSFLSHGTTMILKQYVHGFIIQAYYISSLMVARLRSKGIKVGAQTEKVLERAREQRVEYYDLARSRAGERVREAKERARGTIGAMTGLGEGEGIMGKANETADLVGDYVEEDAEEWRNLYGTGLARWFDEK